MIFGAHIVLYSKDSEADRAFFKDILGLKSVDAGRGWLILHWLWINTERRSSAKCLAEIHG